MRHLAAKAATVLAALAVAALPFTARAATTFTTTSITTDNFTANGNVSFNDASADTIILGQNGGTPDTVQVAGDISLTDTNWTVSAAGAATFGSVNGLTLAGNVDGFQIGGGTAARTFTLTGGNLTLTASGATALTLPSTGTLATLAGSESFSNKSLAMPRVTTGIFDNNSNEILMFPLVAAAVNEFTMGNATTGGNPVFEVTGSDASIGLTLQTKGTGDFDFQTTAATADVLRLRPAAGSVRNTGTITSADLTATRTWTLPDAAGAVVLDTATQTLTNKTLNLPRISGIKDANGLDMLAFSATVSAVNNFQMFNAATGGDPSLLVIGSDANIDMRLQAKGTGGHLFLSTGTADMFLLQPAAGAAAFQGTITSADLTGNQTWTLPNASGTLALTSDITSAAGWTDGGAAVTLVTATDSVGIGSTPNGKLHVTGTLNTAPVMVVQAAASQSGNLQEWKDAAGTTILARLTNIGDLRIRGNGGTAVIETDTTATVNLFNGVPTTVNFAGAATALNIGAASGATTIAGHLTIGGLAADPTGTNGRTYYNSSTNKFRCHENSTWKDCIGGGLSGSGATGQVAFFNGTSSLTSESVFAWDSANRRLGLGASAPNATLELTPGALAATPSLNGTVIRVNGQTFTDNATAASGTSSSFAFSSFHAPTLAAANATVSTTDAATLRIAGAPIAGTNMTITMPMALWVDDGKTRLDGDLHANGNVVLGDQSSDVITMNAAGIALGSDLNIDTGTLYVAGGTNRVAVGTSNPFSKFHVSADGGALNAVFDIGDSVTFSRTGNILGTSMVVAGNGSSFYPILRGVRAGGTLQTPTVAQSGDRVFGLQGIIHDGVDLEATAEIRFSAEGVVSSDVAPQRIAFFTSASDFIGMTERLRIGSSGEVLVTGTLTIGSGSTAVSKHLSQELLNVASTSVDGLLCGTYATVGFSGSVVGDTVTATPIPAVNGIEDVSLSWNAFVSAAGTVVIRACNPTSAAINTDDTQTWRIDLWRH